MSQQLAMNWTEWFAHDGLALAERVREGELRADEVVAQTVAAVELVDARLDGVLEVFEDVTQDANVNRPARDGALYGVPLFLKDLGSRMAGRSQESGSRLMRRNVSEVTDPLVENFLRAGLIPLGRSTTPEFGMTFDTSTDYLGRPKVTRNPWNLERTPGGSSGGSAALVAAGVTPISMASDGGGSTRIPASYCGLVGLKASRGRISMPLNHSEYTWRIAVEGVVTRSVRDSAATLDYLHRKPAGGTFYPMAPPEGSWLEGLSRAPERLRIALSTGPWGREGACDPEVAAKVREFARMLEGLGHRVEEVDDTDLCGWPAMWKGYITQWICSRMNYLPLAERHAPGTPLEGAALADRVAPCRGRALVLHARSAPGDGRQQRRDAEARGILRACRPAAVPDPCHPGAARERTLQPPPRRRARRLGRAPRRRLPLHHARQ